MSIKHFLHLYDKPRQGTAFKEKYLVTGYKDKIVAKGGYDSASCSLLVSETEANRIMWDYLGNVVRVYVSNNPMNPRFEGYIDRITVTSGGISTTRSLENMANRVTVTYYNADSAAANKRTEQTAIVESLTSQAVFGLKEMSMDAGVHYNNADFTHKTVLRSTILSTRSFPQLSVSSQSSSTSGTIVEIEIRGLIYMAFDWQTYASTVNGVVSASTMITRLTGGGDVGANAPFLFETNTVATWDSLITANASFNISRESDTGQTYLQFLRSIIESGDGTNQWVFGITPPNFNSGTRKFYYRLATTTIKYKVFQKRDVGRVRNFFGEFLPGNLVLPDARIRVMEARIGGSTLGSPGDPRNGYLESVEYDGDTGQVVWHTGDNITLDGALQADRYFKHQKTSIGGAPIRQVN